MVKKLSENIIYFDYTDKILIALSTTFSGGSIFSHLKIKKHIGIISSVLVLFFSLSTAVIKKLLYETKKRKKKHNKVLYLGKNKLDCIELLISEAIIDLQISHEEFEMIVNEKKDYDKIKENIKNTKNKDDITENE